MQKFHKFLVFLLSSLLIFSASCSAVKTNEKIDYAVIEYSEERMMDIIEYLSAEDAGRMAGSKGEREAADYIAGKFESLGLETSTQDFPMTAFTIEKVSLEPVTNMILKHGVKVLSFSAPTPAGGLTAEVIPVGMGADDDYSGKDVTGRIALIKRGGEYFRVKTQRAYENGAAAVMFYDPDGEEALAATLTQLSMIPAISIAREDGESIEKSVSEGKSVEAKMIVDSSVLNSTSQNVIAVYESNDNPNGKFVVVGAHYDGVDTPAANDNVSGIAVILEMAAALVEHEIKLPFDVRFIAFGSEEIGLVGSKAYVERMSGAELKNIIAMINYDMVGVGESFVLFTVEETDNSQLLKAGRKILRDMGYSPFEDFTQRSDHASFTYAGVQAMDLQTIPAEYYHTDEDTIEKIKPFLLTDACKLGMGILMDEIPNW